MPLFHIQFKLWTFLIGEIIAIPVPSLEYRLAYESIVHYRLEILFTLVFKLF